MGTSPPLLFFSECEEEMVEITSPLRLLSLPPDPDARGSDDDPLFPQPRYVPSYRGSEIVEVLYSSLEFVRALLGQRSDPQDDNRPPRDILAYLRNLLEAP